MFEGLFDCEMEVLHLWVWSMISICCFSAKHPA